MCTKKKTALNLHVFCRHMREGAEKAPGCSALVVTDTRPSQDGNSNTHRSPRAISGPAACGH